MRGGVLTAFVFVRVDWACSIMSTLTAGHFHFMSLCVLE